MRKFWQRRQPGAPDRAAPGERGGRREVVHIAWPIVISMLSFTAMDVADTLFVGWLGKTELAAVGLATTAIFLLNAFFMGTFRGVNILVAQAHGAATGGHDTALHDTALHDPARNDATLHDRALEIGLIGALLAVPFGIAVIGLSLLDGYLFAAMGGSDEVQALAREYFRIRAMGAVVWYVMLAINGYFQGVGDTRTPMKANLIANGLNIALDPVLIFGLGPIPAMGAAGAAVATIIAQFCGLLVVLPLFARRLTRALWLRLKRAAPVARQILHVGVPVGVHFAVGIGAFTVFTAFLARMGDEVLAGHMIALRIVSLSFLPGRGLSEAACILTGQYFGARDMRSARRAFVSALQLALVLMGLCGLGFWLFAHELASIFNRDPATVAVAASLLLVAGIFQIFDAVAIVASGALNGIGDTRFTMWTSIVCSWVLLVPLGYLFGIALDWGAFGAWFALLAEISVVAVISLWRVRHMMRPA